MTAASALTGDRDRWRMLGATPSGGFEGTDPAAARLDRRVGSTLETVVAISLAGDSLTVDFASGGSMRAQVRGDTLAGVPVRNGSPEDRVWLVRRTAAAYELYYTLWPGEVSDSTYPVEIDPAVPLTTRDGTTRMSFVAHPGGQGPFPVVMERTPYLRVDTANGVFWASRGYT